LDESASKSFAEQLEKKLKDIRNKKISSSKDAKKRKLRDDDDSSLIHKDKKYKEDKDKKYKDDDKHKKESSRDKHHHHESSSSSSHRHDKDEKEKRHKDDRDKHKDKHHHESSSSSSHRHDKDEKEKKHKDDDKIKRESNGKRAENSNDLKKEIKLERDVKETKEIREEVEKVKIKSEPGVSVAEDLLKTLPTVSEVEAQLTSILANIHTKRKKEDRPDAIQEQIKRKMSKIGKTDSDVVDRFMPPPLLLDDSGREVDVFGNVVKKKKTLVATTMINKKLQREAVSILNVEAPGMETDTTKNPFYDPTIKLAKSKKTKKRFSFC